MAKKKEKGGAIMENSEIENRQIPKYLEKLSDECDLLSIVIEELTNRLKGILQDDLPDDLSKEMVPIAKPLVNLAREINTNVEKVKDSKILINALINRLEL